MDGKKIDAMEQKVLDVEKQLFIEKAEFVHNVCLHLLEEDNYGCDAEQLIQSLYDRVQNFLDSKIGGQDYA